MVIAQKVVKEVGPSLGVKVQEMKPLRKTGVILRTTTEADRMSLVKNQTFQKAGLEVNSLKRKHKAVILGVHSGISCDKFVKNVYEGNFKEKFSEDSFCKEFKIMSKPWQETEKFSVVNVVVEATFRSE